MNEPGRPSDLDALKAEHDSVRRHLEHSREIADSVGEVSVTDLNHRLDHAIHTIAHQFLPHARHEEVALYGRFPEGPGAPSLAAVFRREHHEFEHLVEDLRSARAKVTDPLPADVGRELRRILYGMYAILKLHFSAEDDLYISAGDQQTYRMRQDS